METPEFDITDFIGVFPGAVDPNFCDFLCQYIDQAAELAPRNYTHVKDKQICLDAFSPGEAKGVMDYVNGCLYYYINEFSYLTNFSYVSALVLLQKPERGTVVIWPGSFTHLHRGNPPMSDKYIATGWYQGNIGLPQVQTAGINDKQYTRDVSNS